MLDARDTLGGPRRAAVGAVGKPGRIAMARRYGLRFLFCILAVAALAGPAAATDPGDAFWDPVGRPAGVQGTVNAMLSTPGTLYVGGSFSAVRDVPVRYVAALATSAAPDPLVTSASPLGEGLNGAVTGLCEHAGDLVAVGRFTCSGDRVLEHVGRWDGGAWHALGAGLPGSFPRAVASFQGDVYVGAQRWDGAAWENVLQTDAAVEALLVHDGLLYVAGRFTEARGQAVSSVFAWDGAQVLPLAGGAPWPAHALAAAGGVVYAAGEDDVAYTGRGVVSWDGAAWTSEISDRMVEHLGSSGGVVYASAISMWVPHHPVPMLMSNAGGVWRQVADVFPAAMTEHEGDLFVQADPGSDPILLTPGLAAFDDAALRDVFTPPAGCATGFVSLAPFGADLMVGGRYTIADGRRIDGSAILTGGTWFPAGSPDDIPSGYPATLLQLATVGGAAFAVYEWIDWDIGVQELAKLVWDVDRFRWQTIDPPYASAYGGLLQTVGSQLHHLGGGSLWIIDPVTAAFTEVGPLDVDGGGIYDTCDAGGSLVVCGSFDAINGVPTGNVARYVGGAWEAVGNPLPVAYVEAVVGTGDATLAVATWDYERHQVWVFDGASWSELPGAFDRRVDHLAYHRGRLFAAGSFGRVGPVWASGVAVWTGDRWAPVGTGLKGGTYGRVRAVLSRDDALWFAGAFDRAGGLACAGLAAWNGDPTLITGAPSDVPDAAAAAGLLEAARPNPFNPRTDVAFTLPDDGAVVLAVYDLRGRRVRVLADARLEAGRHVRAWDGRDDAGRALPSGIYFARVATAGRTATVKMALVR